jgi:hypothetical protein
VIPKGDFTKNKKVYSILKYKESPNEFFFGGGFASLIGLYVHLFQTRNVLLKDVCDMLY